MSDADTDNLLFPFGVSAAEGLPLSGLADNAIEAMIEEEWEPAPELSAQLERASPSGVDFAIGGEVDANDLSEAGWGIIFAPSVDQKIKDALQPLIGHRKSQGAHPMVVYDRDGYRPGETALDWLRRHNVSLNVVDPSLGVPFYLLIVGSADAIPFEFQYVLDLYWAVGRLWFDTPDEFRQYADSVIRYETAQAVPTLRHIAMFAPKHDFDPATQLFARHVAVPMRDGQGDRPRPIGQRQDFELRCFLAEDASKSDLSRIFRGEIEGGPPALLFSGGHGMAFDLGDARQIGSQGALVCQDWDRSGEISEDHWFSASDLSSDSKVHGLIHFMFACYGGAIPAFDNFDRLNKAPRQIAERPFFAKLPQALLAHPNGGALAVLAHVERAWAYSFQGDKGGSQIQGFRDVVGRLVRGQRLGQATDTFNMRWAALSAQLAELHAEMQHGADVPLRSLGQYWVARDDARNYMVLGDPAVRLRPEAMRPSS